MVRMMVRSGFILVCLILAASVLYVFGGVGPKLRSTYAKYHETETYYRAILHCCNNSEIEIWVPHGETLADQSCPRCKMALNILPDS